MRQRALFLSLIIVLLITSCGGRSDSPSGTAAPGILTSTTFLADITQNIAGDRVKVESLLPVGSDPHSYQPTPQDVTKIAQSKVLIINGAEYEHFLEGLLENAGGEREVIEASAGIGPRTDAGDEHGGTDPHLWLDPNHVVVYVENIREGLTHYDPDGAAIFQSNADAYVAQLLELDAWISEQVSQIPPERRLLVTNHEALGYFADRYGFTIVGAVLPSVSSDASPSAAQMATLIDQIKSNDTPAIFLDEVENPALAQQIADENGVKIVDDLHLESLTDGSPAGTYIDMMKHNVTQIVNALK
ncbi:MAG TPA: metal ABC transporter substrate-binding protein [Anaerolineales bacterium]|nr:metal ABC transporter substrate-binding protein [Anaerolineales bacterium]